MLQELRLQNYRGFRDHAVEFGPLTILAGINNAGKSTIVEALTIVSRVVSGYRSKPRQEAPPWLSHLPVGWGRRPSLAGVDVPVDGLFNNLGDPPAILTASFDSAVFTIYLGADLSVHASCPQLDSAHPHSTADSAFEAVPDMRVLPRVGPVARYERVLQRETVLRHLGSHLSPAHFRNELAMFPLGYERLRTLAEDTWKGLQLHDLSRIHRQEGWVHQLMVRVGDFTGELALMGHGLQMWLQTLWFMVRTPSTASVVLDEPDIYMHADLQRKIIRLLKGRYVQTIIATHSTEIIDEVEPSDIVSVNRTAARSARLADRTQAQGAVYELGSMHNIALSRLGSRRKFLVWEGQDLPLLKSFQNTLFPRSETPFDALPGAGVGGQGQWGSVVSWPELLRQTVMADVSVYCVLDRDFKPEDEIRGMISESRQNGVNLYVWRRKEIENYLLLPEVIARLLRPAEQGSAGTDLADLVALKIDEVVGSMEEDCFQSLASSWWAYQTRAARQEGKPPPDIKTVMQQVRTYLNRVWQSQDGRWGVVSGKAVFSRLSGWSQTEYGISLAPVRVARAVRESDLPGEVVMVVSAIEKGEAFPTETE
ncbi:AAA family ATPase [bacterium]|nr:AAA family ATPase [bacterium]